jgi:hypothetical protein
MRRASVFKQRGIAQNHRQRIVQVVRDVGGQLAQAGVLLRVDELFKQHGLAARGLHPGSQHLDGEQIVRAQRVVGQSQGFAQRGAHCGEQQNALND